MTWWTSGWGQIADTIDTEFLQNLLLFLPVGLVWGWCARRWRSAAVAIVVVPFLLETAQTVFDRGGADVRDWVANALGGAAGLLVASAGRAFTGPDDHSRPARREHTAAYDP